MGQIEKGVWLVGAVILTLIAWEIYSDAIRSSIEESRLDNPLQIDGMDMKFDSGIAKILAEAKYLAVIREDAMQEMNRNGWIQGLGNSFHPETKYRQVACYVLATALEFPKAGDIKVEYNLSRSDFAHDRSSNLNYMIGSIDIFTYEAEETAGKRREELLNDWNIRCALDYSYVFGWSSPGETFYKVNLFGDIEILGDIEAGFSRRLLEALDENPGASTVYIGSGGGAVLEAMAAGRIIRERGLDVQVSGKCFSACPLVLAGGVERRSWTSAMDGDELGFHKISLNGVAVSDSSSIYLDVYRYLEGMGVNGSMILYLMLSAEPEGMVRLYATDPYLCASGILNQVKLSCRTEGLGSL